MLRFKDGAAFTLVITQLTNATGNFYVTGATREGPFSFKVPMINMGGYQLREVPIPDIPIWISVTTPITTVAMNALYVTVALKINGDVLRELVAGYVYSAKALTWPAQTFNRLLPDTIGAISKVTGANPAAGAECSDSVPSNTTWHLRAIKIPLVTSATVANRYVHVNIAEFDGAEIEVFSSVAHAASSTRNYWLMPIGAPGVYVEDNDIIIPIPPEIWLKSGSTISTVTTGIQAGDNFGSPIYWIEKWLDAV